MSGREKGGRGDVEKSDTYRGKKGRKEGKVTVKIGGFQKRERETQE